jgi:hypothetical protein
MNKNTMCPVCGYELEFTPWCDDSASHEYCPACGIQFGFHDVPEGAGLRGTREEIWTFWRKRWMDRGMLWSSVGERPPEGWNPSEHLKRVGVDALL